MLFFTGSGMQPPERVVGHLLAGDPTGHVFSLKWSMNERRKAIELAATYEKVTLDVLGRAFELGQRLLFKHCIVIAYAVSCCLLP